MVRLVGQRQARRRVHTENGDVLHPKGDLADELLLATHHTALVIDVLGALLTAERRARIDEGLRRRTLALQVASEVVEDPHNNAAIVRTADAFGLQRVHCIETQHRFKSTRRVTKGTHKWVDIVGWRSAEEYPLFGNRPGTRSWGGRSKGTRSERSPSGSSWTCSPPSARSSWTTPLATRGSQPSWRPAPRPCR